jgi:hypothetical protein
MTIAKVCTVGGLVIALIGAGLYLHGHRILSSYRQQVLEVPVRFDDGFSTSQQFTVDKKAPYYVGLAYHKQTFSQPTQIDDNFTVEFTVASDGSVIASGTNTNDAHAAIRSKDYTIRLLGPFDAQPGQTYNLSLRVLRADPELAATAPKLLVLMHPRSSEDDGITGSLFTVAGIGLAAVGAIIAATLITFIIVKRVRAA